ncbi:TetR/AcrR family transcriptional regulator [Rhizorhabdus dicambivorans]|uniref:TetR/AcrR family transcriptional regulator n=2 Tax=Rhizorhabdus dicambivorans TaxID=1850238 RepID=A0A2A4FU01_9SPHN|nr:TetR/AcrR family transcriptional regulator [Rhizorhabdus dicambivorans]PCE41174.1 TetR/AcrR family transcriptional regulator [Rhizorhabdus dicambivorans]
MHHGFARTTMGMIAEAAGMSRPALYQLFKGKEAVLKAVIDSGMDAMLTKMTESIADVTSPAERLRRVCMIWSAASFERSQSNPALRDLTGNPAYVDGYNRFIALVAEILAASSAGSGDQIAVPDLARLLVLAIRGFKSTAVSLEDLEGLILRQICLTIDHIDHVGSCLTREPRTP